MLTDKQKEMLVIGTHILDMHGQDFSYLTDQVLSLKLGFPVILTGRVKLDQPFHAMLKTLIEKQFNHGQAFIPTNKYLIVISENVNGDVVCGYSYDNVRGGLITFRYF